MPEPGDPMPRSDGRRSVIIVPAGVAAVLAVLCYANALHNPFVFDDIREVVENPSVESSSLPTVLTHNITRPVVNLSYAIDYRLWGSRDPFGFHATNLAIHVVNVLLLYAFMWRVARDCTGARVMAAAATAFVTAGLFAVHPLMTEAVGFVSSRSELLSSAFLLASLLCFHEAFERKEQNASLGVVRASAPLLAAGFVSFALALASKETAVVLPLVLVVYELFLRGPGERTRRTRITTVYAPLLAVVALAAAARLWLFVGVEYAGAERASVESVLTSLYASVRYLRLIVAPVGQSLVPPMSAVQSVTEFRFVLASLVLTAGAVAAMLFRRQMPLAGFGILWFFLFLLPSSALILLSEYGQAMAEHRAYLASGGIFMAAGAAFSRLARFDAAAGRVRLLAVGTPVIVVLAVLASLTIARNRVWASPISLWTDAERKAPQTWAAVHGLADAYRLEGDCQAAVPIYQRALTLGPLKSATYLGLASCLSETRRIHEADAVLRLATLRLPEDIDIKIRLALLEERWLDSPGEVLRLCGEVLAAVPSHLEARECVRRNQERLSARPR